MRKLERRGRNVLILWRWSEAEDLLGWPCKASIGSQMEDMRRGDVLYVIAYNNEELFALGSVSVETVRKERRANPRDEYGAYYAGGRNLSGPFQMTPLGEAKWKLRFQQTDADRLDRRKQLVHQVRQHRFLTSESAKLLSRILKQGRGVQIKVQRVFAVEGKEMEKALTVRERDPAVRRAALQHHGRKCMVCSFDFVKKYGEFARDCVEVHHLKLVSGPNLKRKRTKIEDVIVVCPNCHRALHRFDHSGAWQRFKNECGVG